MKKCIIFGAGQVGRMLKNLLSTEFRVASYTDNNRRLWGTYVNGVSVVSPEEALYMNPDCIWIATVNRDSEAEIGDYLREHGFVGKIESSTDFRDKYDIRLAVLRLIAERMHSEGVLGEVAELGVYQGIFASEINKLFPGRQIYLFDTFTGFCREDIEVEKSKGLGPTFLSDFSTTSVEQVLSSLSFPDMARVFAGRFPETAPDDPTLAFSFVSLDADLYNPTYEGLRYFYPRLSRGGVIMIHDYNSLQFPGVREAVNQYCNENAVFIIPLPDFHGTVILQKT
ncbi:MAG: class I SAM-dependent methyltransferase [Oscillospiraceae bacterium]|nr:class I SAM-dependent methyltransferase [Oscillospiraceae bacterium]